MPEGGRFSPMERSGQSIFAIVSELIEQARDRTFFADTPDRFGDQGRDRKLFNIVRHANRLSSHDTVRYHKAFQRR